ncbi:hypothetical protein HanLR1_Chr16g0629461 [Helianthus annuus]|nr:hypothetical protein HanLR1_Chr16g0629461 [Helianthus annuus]
MAGVAPIVGPRDVYRVAFGCLDESFLSYLRVCDVMVYGSLETVGYDVALDLAWSTKMTYGSCESIEYDVALDLACVICMLFVYHILLLLADVHLG